MSGYLDVKARETAERLLQKFGMNATYKKIIQGTFNPTTQTMTNTETDYAITIYIDKPNSGDITSGLASATDVMILVSAKELGVEVNVGDKIVGDKTYEVKADKPIYSGALIAMHQIICVIR